MVTSKGLVKVSLPRDGLASRQPFFGGRRVGFGRIFAGHIPKGRGKVLGRPQNYTLLGKFVPGIVTY